MAKKSLKPEGSPTKRKKKPSSDVAEDHLEERMEPKVKKKKRKMEAEEEITVKDDDVQGQKKKEKKEKRKKILQTEISEPAHELEGEEDLTPEERRVLERKMKKILKKEEKKRLKDEGQTAKTTEASGPIAPQQALDYLICWAENRTQWKFQKTRQTWLLQHMFDSEKIPDEKFSMLLEYLEGLRGAARDTSVEKALALVEESGQTPEDKAVQQRAHRAREVIQLLS